MSEEYEWVPVGPGRSVRMKRGEAREMQRQANPWGSHESLSMGVHPSQIAENHRFNKEMGVPQTDYTKDGCPKFRDARHQAKYLKARGAYNKDGIFS